MLPLEHPDRIHVAFDGHRLVANAGLLLPATLATPAPAGPALSSGHSASSHGLATAVCRRFLSLRRLHPATGRVEHFRVADLTERLHQVHPARALRQRDHHAKGVEVFLP